MLRYTTKEKLAGFLELLVENDKKVFFICCDTILLHQNRLHHWMI